MSEKLAEKAAQTLPVTAMPGRRDRSEVVVLAAAAAALFLGLGGALAHAWICDDAFISFRYADHLVRGLGLVFNAGERVEGYTNFLWTLWIALGLKLGCDAERWAAGWGVAAYGILLVLLCSEHLRWRRRLGVTGLTLPLAALLVALHEDAQVYATGGLETAWFALLAFATWLALARERHAPGAGFLLALTALTRPDGVLFAVPAGIYWLAFGRPRLRSVLQGGLAFLGPVAAHWAWRVAYYGDFFPNTFYAKSAWLPWYSQGWIYLRLYLAKYWVLAVGFPLAAIAFTRAPRAGEAVPPLSNREAWSCALAAAMALLYGLYVVRVGGDFMYARFLIPTVPFCAILLDWALLRLTAARPRLNLAWGGALALALLLTPHPLQGPRRVHGIINEWSYLSPLARSQYREYGLALRRFFEGLPVRLAFYGSQARMTYYSRVAMAIEAEAGLTDRFIARQPLERRGRVGHEKEAPPSYLIHERRVHFAVAPDPGLEAELQRAGYPKIWFGDVPGYVLTWDEDLMREIQARGAVVTFPARQLNSTGHWPRSGLARRFAPPPGRSNSVPALPATG